MRVSAVRFTPLVLVSEMAGGSNYFFTVNELNWNVITFSRAVTRTNEMSSNRYMFSGGLSQFFRGAPATFSGYLARTDLPSWGCTWLVVLIARFSQSFFSANVVVKSSGILLVGIY
jgi:hypothetical protein